MQSYEDFLKAYQAWLASWLAYQATLEQRTDEPHSLFGAFKEGRL